MPLSVDYRKAIRCQLPRDLIQSHQVALII
jgi:hypothetical protein